MLEFLNSILQAGNMLFQGLSRGGRRAFAEFAFRRAVKASTLVARRLISVAFL